MTLADRQAALVNALVEGGDDPPGFHPDRLAATRAALLRKRAGEVARAWPELRTAFGASWVDCFGGWTRGRAPAGALAEGWHMAQTFRSTLPDRALVELAVRECTHLFDGDGPPKPRRGPAFRLVAGSFVIQVGGRVKVWNRDRVRSV